MVRILTAPKKPKIPKTNTINIKKRRTKARMTATAMMKMEEIQTKMSQK